VSAGPDFLVIGAQKCGTTTLYEDLRSHPQIVLKEKEQAGLLDNDLGTAPGRRRYLAAFPAMPAGVVAGEVSTRYAMRPEIDAASLAREVLDDVKVVYIVRDPIARVISHHHHFVHAGRVEADIDRAVRERRDLVDNSRYASQLRPWLEAFGRDSVHAVRFEDYTADRSAGVREVQRFLGVPEREPVEPDVVHNAAANRTVASRAWSRVRWSRAYLAVRPLIGERLRHRLASLVVRPSPERPAGPSADTLAWLVSELAPEVSELAALLGTEKWWDLEATYLDDAEETR
jgi:hypothetical protein